MKTILKFLAVAAAALTCLAACKKDNGNENNGTNTGLTEADMVGTWVVALGDGETDPANLVLNSDGTYTHSWEGSEEDPETGSWSVKDGKFSIDLADDTELMASNTALALIYIDEEFETRSFALYFKKGATVKSPALTDGRWDAPRWGYKPEKYTETEDYWCSFIVDGSSLDAYILAWGFHMAGTYSQDGGTLKYNVANTWQGIYRDSGSWGWSAVGPPGGLGLEDTWDYTIPNMNPETFEIRSPWWNEEGNPMENSIISDMPLVITDDGTHAYGVLYSICAWFYKR